MNAMTRETVNYGLFLFFRQYIRLLSKFQCKQTVENLLLAPTFPNELFLCCTLRFPPNITYYCFGSTPFRVNMCVVYLEKKIYSALSLLSSREMFLKFVVHVDMHMLSCLCTVFDSLCVHKNFCG